MANDTLNIHIDYFTGFEGGDDDVGYPYYVASCEEIVAITDGRTWHELMVNIEEMLAAHFEGEDTIALYGIMPKLRRLSGH